MVNPGARLPQPMHVVRRLEVKTVTEDEDGRSMVWRRIHSILWRWPSGVEDLPLDEGLARSADSRIWARSCRPFR